MKFLYCRGTRKKRVFLQFSYLKKLQLISEIRSLSADCLPSLSAREPMRFRLVSYSGMPQFLPSIKDYSKKNRG